MGGGRGTKLTGGVELPAGQGREQAACSAAERRAVRAVRASWAEGCASGLRARGLGRQGRKGAGRGKERGAAVLGRPRRELVGCRQGERKSGPQGEEVSWARVEEVWASWPALLLGLGFLFPILSSFLFLSPFLFQTNSN